MISAPCWSLQISNITIRSWYITLQNTVGIFLHVYFLTLNPLFPLIYQIRLPGVGLGPLDSTGAPDYFNLHVFLVPLTSICMVFWSPHGAHLWYSNVGPHWMNLGWFTKVPITLAMLACAGQLTSHCISNWIPHRMSYLLPICCFVYVPSSSTFDQDRSDCCKRIPLQF